MRNLIECVLTAFATYWVIKLIVGLMAFKAVIATFGGTIQ